MSEKNFLPRRSDQKSAIIGMVSNPLPPEQWGQTVGRTGNKASPSVKSNWPRGHCQGSCPRQAAKASIRPDPRPAKPNWPTDWMTTPMCSGVELLQPKGWQGHFKRALAAARTSA